jgi:inhibitor of cysteine peptidase
MSDIHVEENGAIVTASPGDRIVVTLPENATTGYQWSIVNQSDLLELEGTSLTLPEHAAPGAGGERRIVLRARQSGQANVNLKLRREWEGDLPENNRFHFQVNVR